MSVEVLTFDELLARLGFTDDDPRGQAEHISICHQGSGVAFSSEVRVWSASAGTAARLTENSQRNIWHSVHALSEVAKGRGTADDVVRLTSLVPDLDVKEGGCGDLTTAELIIDDLSAALGELPVGAVYSGHGIQPYWSVECQSGRALMADGNAEAKRLLDRFKALVFSIAARYGCGADSVYDLARVMRTPGSVNWKDPENPVPVRCFADDGKPMTVEQIHTALDAAGIPEDPEKKRAKKQPRGEKKSKDDKPLYAVSAAMTPGKPSAKVRARLAEALTDVAVETDRHHKTRDHTLALLRYGYNGEPGVGEALEALDRAFVFTVGPDRMGGEEEAAGEFARMCSNAETLLAAEPPQQPFVWPGPTPTFGNRREDADDGAEQAEADLWRRRPKTLGHIHDYAQARRVSPLGMLGSTLVRVLATIPPNVVLPPLVGGRASLNSLVALVGASGAGKDSAEVASRDGVLLGDCEIPVVPIGSGEGLSRTFRPQGTKLDEPNSIIAAIFSALEIDTWAALAQRNGSTLTAEIRKLYTGSTLGFGNAGRDTRNIVVAHSYRACVLLGVQPLRSGPLLTAADGGLPQRLVWFPATDPTAPDRAPTAPEPLTITPPTWERPSGLTSVGRIPDWDQVGDHIVLRVPDIARDEVDTFSRAALRGDPGVDPLDRHALLTRLKVGAALMAMESRTSITEEDWELAGVVMTVSATTRDGCQKALSEQSRKKATARAHEQADREAIIRERLTDDLQKRVLGAINRKLQRVGRAMERELLASCSSVVRAEFPAVFDLLLDQQYLVVDGGEGDDTYYRRAE